MDPCKYDVRAGRGPALDRAQGPRPRPPVLITLLAGAEFKFWDPCAQNKTPEISKVAFSGILGLLCTEQNVEHLKTYACSGILGLLCAEQNVGNLKHMHFQIF